jgi:hypothetical protein
MIHFGGNGSVTVSVKPSHPKSILVQRVLSIEISVRKVAVLTFHVCMSESFRSLY